MPPEDEQTGAPAESPPVVAAVAPVVPAPKVEIRNSLWCVDRAGRVGMVIEINSGIASFEVEGGETEMLPAESLRIALASQLPSRVIFTAEQLSEYGYL